MKTAAIILASAGVGQAFMPARSSWTIARNVAVRSEEGGFMPTETPAVYEAETKKMIGAMEGYIQGAEAIAAAGSADLGTEFASIPSVPELVGDLFGEKSEAYKVATAGGTPMNAADLAKGAVSDVADSIGYSSEYSADFCDVGIWWRAPEVVKARWGADSKAYKMAQAAADQVAEQSTDAQLDSDWDALYDFENSYVGGIPSISAADVKAMGDEEKAMFAAMDNFKSAPPSLTDDELAADHEPAWAAKMKEEDDELLLRLKEKLGDDQSVYNTEKWNDADPLKKIGEAFGTDSQTYKDAQENMAAFASPPTAEEFDESLKAFLGDGSERYLAAKKSMQKSAAPAPEAKEGKAKKAKA